MRKIILLILILALTAVPVRAMDYTAPSAPDSAEDLMPAETESFAEGLLEILKDAVALLEPEVARGMKTCLALVAIAMLTSVLQMLPGNTTGVVELAGCLAVAMTLLGKTSTLIHLGAETVTQMSEYGKLLLPVMTAAMAAQGGVTSATALYAGTAAFDTLLGSMISHVLIPMIYMFLILSAAGSATGTDRLKKVRDFVKWLMTWLLKMILYVFTGYMTVTGVVSGTTDATALKAAKLTLSGMVPVVGGILSDASEAVLVGAGVMKNAAGIYGLLAITAVWIAPFFKIGVQYLMLKLTASLCAAFDVKRPAELIDSFSGAMGLLLGMTGTMCMLLLISTVCFMKGVS